MTLALKFQTFPWRSLMIIENKSFKIDICDKTGATSAIISLENGFNWVLSDSNWGLVEGFETQSVVSEANCVKVNTFNSERNVQITIEKSLDESDYFESYKITNHHVSDVFLTKDNFGIPFSYDCLYDKRRDFMNECCISHLWCGGDCAWIYSVRCSGEAPYLVMNLTEGAIDDYSISYDISRTKNASFYRGAFLLHPRNLFLLPKETKTLTFRYRLQNQKPESAPLDHAGAIRFTADKYTVKRDEEISLLFESASRFENLKLSCEDKSIPFESSENRARAKIKFQTTGERLITAEADGKVTHLKINVILPIGELLQRRARFICEKQQYLKEDSNLFGAYLVYDDETKSLYYDSAWQDYNAGNERIGMGVLVCKALQEKFDQKLFQSLKLHRSFVERELFDSESGMVYDNVAVKKDFPRIYNFPWVSTYYLEWYNLSGEVKCLENSAKILIKFYENTHCKLGAQCIEAYKILTALKKEGLDSLYNKLLELFLCYIEKIDAEIVEHEGHTNETSYVSEIPNQTLSYFSQAALLTGKEKYLQYARDSLKKSQCFFANQPDFHLNCVNVRYWDRYWFGKIKSYGDVFPHYWSTLAAWGMYWYNKATNSSQTEEMIYNNLTGNLCIYREDGFAHNNYLYPYKVIQYSANPEKQNKYLTPGVFYGKSYDAFANDQDWALYYASSVL